MISAEYKDLMARHLKAENNHDLAATLATLTEDCVFDDRGLGKIFRGRKAVGEYYQMWWQAFAMTVHTEQRHFPAPDLAIVETHFKGKHIGNFFGLEATGHTIDLSVAVFITLRDGLLAGERFYWDKVTLFQQLQLPVIQLQC